MNESTLSKHIKKLEKELQVSLFDRNTRKVSLTSFGKCLIPYARSIVETEKNFLEDLEKKIQAQSSQLVLGVIPSMVQYRITDILVDFRKKTPKPDRHPGSRGRHHLSDRSPDPRKPVPWRFCATAICIRLMTRFLKRFVYEGSARHPASVRPSEGSFRKHLPKRVIRRRFCDLKSGHVAASALSLSLCASCGFQPNIVLECKRMDSIFLASSHSIWGFPC